MRMEFKLLISGGDSLKKKFSDALQANPTLHMDLIKWFGHSVMMTLRLGEEDKICIEGFRAGEIPDLPPITDQEKTEVIEKFLEKNIDN